MFFFFIPQTIQEYQDEEKEYMKKPSPSLRGSAKFARTRQTTSPNGHYQTPRVSGEIITFISVFIHFHLGFFSLVKKMFCERVTGFNKKKTKKNFLFSSGTLKNADGVLKNLSVPFSGLFRA